MFLHSNLCFCSTGIMVWDLAGWWRLCILLESAVTTKKPQEAKETKRVCACVYVKVVLTNNSLTAPERALKVEGNREPKPSRGWKSLTCGLISFSKEHMHENRTNPWILIASYSRNLKRLVPFFLELHKFKNKKKPKPTNNSVYQTTYYINMLLQFSHCTDQYYE